VLVILDTQERAGLILHRSLGKSVWVRDAKSVRACCRPACVQSTVGSRSLCYRGQACARRCLATSSMRSAMRRPLAFMRLIEALRNYASTWCGHILRVPALGPTKLRPEMRSSRQAN